MKRQGEKGTGSIDFSFGPRSLESKFDLCYFGTLVEMGVCIYFKSLQGIA